MFDNAELSSRSIEPLMSICCAIVAKSASQLHDIQANRPRDPGPHRANRDCPGRNSDYYVVQNASRNSPHRIATLLRYIDTGWSLKCRPVDDIRLIFAYTGSIMSRYDRPSHRVFMTFFYRAGWQVQFVEADLKTALPRTFTFSDPEKIRELAKRGEAWSDSESRQMLDLRLRAAEAYARPICETETVLSWGGMGEE